jgi:hypothetical protein
MSSIVHQLHSKIAALEAAPAHKLAELDLLEAQEKQAQSNPIGTVHNNSTPKDMIHLFHALFRGRDDVYARRFENANFLAD